MRATPESPSSLSLPFALSDSIAASLNLFCLLIQLSAKKHPLNKALARETPCLPLPALLRLQRHIKRSVHRLPLASPEDRQEYGLQCSGSRSLTHTLLRVGCMPERESERESLINFPI